MSAIAQSISDVKASSVRSLLEAAEGNVLHCVLDVTVQVQLVRGRFLKETDI